MLDFSNNINFLGPPPDIINELRDSNELYSQYPDYQHNEAKVAIASHFEIAPDSIAIGIGSTELFSIIPKLVLSNSIGITPSFWEYQYFFQKDHSHKKFEKITLKEAMDFVISKNELIKIIEISSAELCYIANPNNPTTTMFSREDLIEVIEYFKKKIFVIDETYLQFSKNHIKNSLFSYASNKNNLIVITSASKIFSLPGLRIGYCSSHPDNIKKIHNYILPYGINPLSLKIIPSLLKQKEFINYTQQQYQKNGDYFIGCLKNKLNNEIKIYNSGTAFILVYFHENIINSSILLSLLEKGIKVRSGMEFNELGIDWMRLSIRKINEINYFIENLTELI